jgi:hypothetical protein
MNNSEFARLQAVVADALTEYDHLPPIGLSTIMRSGPIFLSPAVHGHDAVIALAQWAAAFDSPVELETSPNCEINTRVKLAGRVDVRIYVNLARQQVHELGVRLGVTVSPTGSTSAEQLLAVLHVDQAETVPAVANA